MKSGDRIRLGIQMFNFFAGGDWEHIKTQEDAEQLLSKLAEAGYDGVEWLNFSFQGKDLDISGLKQKMDELGLETCSLHFHYQNAETLEEDCRIAAERCLLLGTDKLIFAFSLPTMFGIQPDEKGNYTPQQIDEWASCTDHVLSVLQDACKKTGIKVLYHNHNTEFLKGTDGRYFLDMIHPEGLEPDVYWISKGLDGKVSSALDYIRNYDGKIMLLHMKDGMDGSVHTGEMCGWGKGTYPLQKIVDCAKELNLPWVVLENDAPNNFGTSGLEDALECAEYAAKHIDLKK